MSCPFMTYLKQHNFVNFVDIKTELAQSRMYNGVIGVQNFMLVLCSFWKNSKLSYGVCAMQFEA